RCLRHEVGDRTRREGDLAVDRDSLGDLDAAQIEREHQRQQQRELDRGNAASIADELLEAETGARGESGDLQHDVAAPSGSSRNAAAAISTRLPPAMSPSARLSPSSET